MKTLRRLSAALLVTIVLGLPVFAGETSGPPCSTDPGEILTPPCASMTATPAPTAPGETQTPPAAESFDVLALAETLLTLVF